jgi:hypothetical protein
LTNETRKRATVLLVAQGQATAGRALGRMYPRARSQCCFLFAMIGSAALICLLPLFRLGERANSKEERHEKEGQLPK